MRLRDKSEGSTCICFSGVFKYLQRIQSRGDKLISAPLNPAPKENDKCLTFLSFCSLRMLLIAHVQGMNIGDSKGMNEVVS